MLPAYYSSKYCIEIYITFNLRHEDNRLGLLVEQSSSILYTNAKLAELITYVAIKSIMNKYGISSHVTHNFPVLAELTKGDKQKIVVLSSYNLHSFLSKLCCNSKFLGSNVI